MTDQLREKLYVGMSGSIAARVARHRKGTGSLFCRRNRLTHLVYVETLASVDAAEARERQLKRWRRSWKLDLISRNNPTWDDLDPARF